MRNRGLLSILLMVVLVVFAGVGCGDDDDSGGSSGSDLKTIKSGTLTVGSDIPYKPFEFGKPPYTGFDVELVRAVAKPLDLKVRFVKTPFDTIFRGLAQGNKFDMVASSVTITDERKKTVEFSAPYFPADQSLMVKKGSDIKTVKDLAGKTIGAQLGTTGADYAKDKTEAKTVRTYDLVDDAFQALESGQIEAVVNDFPVSKYAEREHSNLEVVQTIPTGEEYGFAFAKSGDDLRKAVDEQLKAVKSNGTYTRLYRRYFSADPPKKILN